MRNFFTRSLSLGDIVLALIILALIVPYGWIIYSNQSLFQVSDIYNKDVSSNRPQLAGSNTQATEFPDLNLSLIIPPGWDITSEASSGAYKISLPESGISIELASTAVANSFTECQTSSPGQVTQETVLISQPTSDKSLTIVGSRLADGSQVLRLQNTWLKARYISDPNTRDGQISQNLSGVVRGGTYFTCSKMLSPSAIPNSGKESLKGFIEVFSVDIVSESELLNLNNPSEAVQEALSILKTAKQL